MPEGDTLFRTATVLRRALLGGVLTEAVARPGPLLRHVPDLTPLVGMRVTGVESRGKHLLITVGEGQHRRILRTHLRMAGSWHWYRPGEPWRGPERRATVVLRTESAVAVCFSCPTVELLTDAGVARSAALRRLGPDLLAPGTAPAEPVARFRARPDAAIGEALLDQSLAAGIGNVVRNEALFMEQISPFRPVRSLDDATLERLLARSQQILRAASGGGPRVTTGDRRRGEGLWVYRRAGRPCRRCGTIILFGRQGPLTRHTYWCPRCQE